MYYSWQKNGFTSAVARCRLDISIVLCHCYENDRKPIQAEIFRIIPDIVTGVLIGADTERFSLFTFCHRDAGSRMPVTVATRANKLVVSIEMRFNVAAIAHDIRRHKIDTWLKNPPLKRASSCSGCEGSDYYDKCLTSTRLWNGREPLHSDRISMTSLRNASNA